MGDGYKRNLENSSAAGKKTISCFTKVMIPTLPFRESLILAGRGGGGGGDIFMLCGFDEKDTYFAFFCFTRLLLT